MENTEGAKMKTTSKDKIVIWGVLSVAFATDFVLSDIVEFPFLINLHF